MLAPGTPDSDDLLAVTLTNVATLVVFIAVAFPLGTRGVARLSEPLERWLTEERPATRGGAGPGASPSRALALDLGQALAGAAVVFTAVNATYSP